MQFKDQKEDRAALTPKDHIIAGLWLAHEFLKSEEKADEDKAYEIFKDHIEANGLCVIEVNKK